MCRKFCILFIFTNLMLLGNPHNPVEMSTTISVEVVRPIEIVHKNNIFHSAIRGVSKRIEDSFEIEVKASPNQEIEVSYDRIVPLTDKTGRTIDMTTDYLEGATIGTLAGTRGSRNTYRIDSPAYGSTRVYRVPYSIELTGREAAGDYSFPDTVLEITGNPGSSVMISAPQTLTLTKAGIGAGSGVRTTAVTATFGLGTGGGKVTTDGTNATATQILPASGSAQASLLLGGNTSSAALDAGIYSGTINIQANYN